MKKRVLSLLLMLLMLVSAVPMLAFATSAATAEEPAVNYDELYIIDGLQYAVDFYTLNDIWGGIAPEVPTDLSDIYTSDADRFTSTKWTLISGSGRNSSHAIRSACRSYIYAPLQAIMGTLQIFFRSGTISGWAGTLSKIRATICSTFDIFPEIRSPGIASLQARICARKLFPFSSTSRTLGS